MKSKIGVIGLWHLGCVISVSWTKKGHKVIGFDYDLDRVQNLQRGKPPLFEPHLKEGIQEGFNNCLLSFSNNIKSLSECDYIFLAYDTPVKDDDSSDTSILEKSVNDVSGIMKDGSILIISSQSPAGYCRNLRELMHLKNETLEIAYSPENLRLGEALECYRNPGRIILGTALPSCEKKCVELFSEITDQILTMNLESAEMVKHGINSFLAMSIVFTNSLSDICEESKANIKDVVRGMKSDIRIGQKAYLSPGIGFSGGTLGRDLKVLDEVNRKANGYAKLFGFVHTSNNERKLAILRKIKKILTSLEGKTIGVLGLTYKPGTSTLRRSLPLEIVDLLIDEKVNVKVFDPKADYGELPSNQKFIVERNIFDVAKDSDMLLVLTEWPEFVKFDWSVITSTLKSKIIFDTKNCLDDTLLTKIGFNYYSVGR